MYSKGFARIGIIFIIFAYMITTPLNVALANPNNQMIGECIDNPEACEDSQTIAVEEPETVGLSLWDYIKMLFSLLFVLGLLLFILKFINKRNLNYQQNTLIRNIGGVSVGTQKSVQLLHIGNTLYIVGVGDNVQLLKEVNDPDEINTLLEYYNEKQTFASTTPYFMDLLKKFKSNDKQNNTTDNDHNFGELLNKKITDIKNERKSEINKWKEKERDK